MLSRCSPSRGIHPTAPTPLRKIDWTRDTRQALKLLSIQIQFMEIPAARLPVEIEWFASALSADFGAGPVFEQKCRCSGDAATPHLP